MSSRELNTMEGDRLAAVITWVRVPLTNAYSHK